MDLGQGCPLWLCLADAGRSALTAWDWAVLAAYAAVLIGTGVYFTWKSRRQASERDYFLAGSRMPVWAVAVSTLATMQSAATFIGAPQDAYSGDLTYLSANIGAVLAAVVLAYVFIPAYYRLGVTTPYQLLRVRFGPGAMYASSWAYLIGRIFANGARVYVGAIPVAFALFGDREPQHLAIAISLFMAFGIIYTLIGGLASVIWTDVVQVCVYIGAAVVALVVLWVSIRAPGAAILEALSTGGPDGTSKLTVIRSGIDTARPLLFNPASPFTLLTACTGWMLLMLAAFGTDQDMVQRLLTCRTAKEGSRSIITSVLIGIPAVAIFSAIGLLLWVFYQKPELRGATTPEYIMGDTADIFLKFILREMPAGAAGLMIAGVLAAGPAGINASLNSMAATLVSDFYKPVIAPGRSDRHYVTAGRAGVVLCGVVLGVFALVCIPWQQQSGENIINFVLGVMGFAYAGLLAIFLTALFTKRGSTGSCIAALLAGFMVVLSLQPLVLRWWGSVVPLGGNNADGTSFTLANVVIAAPWRLVIGLAFALPICLLAKGHGRGVADQPTPA